MNGFKEILIARLESKGIELRVVPGFVRSLANTLSFSPQMSSREVNKRLQRLGWSDFELDDHTFQLAKAVLEGERFAEKGYEPPVWFKRPFGGTSTTMPK